jgi:hypothetical protein
MNFDKLLQTVSEIVENENIEKNGLILTYELHPKAHLAMNMELYYKTTGSSDNFEPSDEFEVEIAGILIKFVKKVYTEEN